MGHIIFTITCAISLAIVSQVSSEMTLLKGGKEVSCVAENATTVDDYCLKVDLQPGENYRFNCTFNGNDLYTCKSKNDCQECLKGFTFEREDAPCFGIPLADFSPKFVGTYECVTEMLGRQKLKMQFCNYTAAADLYTKGHNEQDVLSSSVPHFEEETTVKWFEIETTVIEETPAFPTWVICIIVLALILIIGFIIGYCCSQKRTRSHQPIPQDPPQDDHRQQIHPV